MNDKGNLIDERPPLLPTIIGTGFGSGFWPWGPGTAGSVLAALIWIVMAGLGQAHDSVQSSVWLDADMHIQSLTLGLAILFFILGTWATEKLQPYWGEDPSRVVVDEMVGMWIPLSLLSANDSWWWVLVALVLFRFFDMVKPLGIKKLDEKKGAIWVMVDDVVGGIYAAVSMVIIKVVVALAF